MNKVTLLSGLATWLCLLSCVMLSIVAARLMYMDNFVPGVEYSNRVFARPALGYAIVLVTYAAIRLQTVDWKIKILAWPFCVLVSYGLMGLLLLFINGIVELWS